MSTLTRMEKTATGWKCPRCGSTQEDELGVVRMAECNCAGGYHPVGQDGKEEAVNDVKHAQSREDAR